MGGFRKVSLDGTPHFSIHTWTCLAIIHVVSRLFLCLFWISLWLRIGVHNILASKTCVKLLKPPKIQIPTPKTSLSDLVTHSWFHSMLFALPSYQFPYTVMNRCLYLRRRRSTFLSAPLRWRVTPRLNFSPSLSLSLSLSLFLSL
jgi:hypothetical protein